MIKLFRKCSICGKKLVIEVNKKGHYKNGHYFGKIPIPTSDGRILEYWECNKCFNKD